MQYVNQSAHGSNTAAYSFASQKRNGDLKSASSSMTPLWGVLLVVQGTLTYRAALLETCSILVYV